jgi:hypothetical protein
MAERQFATPLIMRKGKCTELSRISVTDRRVDEDWLQELLFKHPHLIPLHEIEGLFADSIPVVRELPTGAGSIDLLYVNSHGHLTIVETKLWRNPEAATQVVAQIIKYASALAGWSYEELANAVRKAGLTRGKDPLLDLAKGVYGSKFDQGEFRSQVKESLRLGRFLLLIVGDHIREDLEELTEFLQQTPRLGFTLALVEIALFREHPKTNDVLFVQPRIVARTREVTRAVVEIKVPIDPSKVDVTIKEDKSPGRARPGPMPIDVFLNRLEEETDKRTRQFAEWVLKEAPRHQINKIELREAGPVLKYVHEASGTDFNFGQLHYEGVLSATWYLYYRFEEIKELRPHLRIYRDYRNDVARCIPGASWLRHKGPKEVWEEIVYREKGKPDGSPPLVKLIPRKEKWFAAIDKAVKRIKAVLGD